jgi:hypothetical protein
MKQLINKVTGLQVGFTTEWVILDNGEWRVLTIDESSEAIALYEAELKAKAQDDAIATWKSSRQALVDNIEVTLNTVIYQGDELSQTRMSRAIVALPDDVVTISWVAKDNTVQLLNRVQLTGLLLQAGQAQSAVWNLNRPVEVV